jgi:cytochrome c
MNAKSYVIVGAVALASAVSGPAHAQGSPQRGAMVYRACAACHSLEPGMHLTGPSLADLWNKKAASVADFPRYSRALKAQEFLWDETTLSAWLANPVGFVAGNQMTFRGIEDDKTRQDLIAFLRLAMGPGGAKAAVAQRLIPESLARGQTPEDLSKAGPAEQVASIRYCQNSYFVTTANGQEHSFWALNLRLKVDSSALGPKGGKPVLTGSGMQGDRASLVFPDPAQISAFIQSKC